MSSSDRVLQTWNSVADILDELAAHGTAQRRWIGPDLSVQDVSDGLMLCLATLDLGPPAPVNTWRLLLQKQVSTTAVLAVACERPRSWRLLAPSVSGML
jgi:hypothetical protein